MDGFLKFIGTMVVALTQFLFRGFVLAKLWLWIVVAIFPKVPVLTIMQAIGLTFVASVFAGQVNVNEDKNQEQFGVKKKSYGERVFTALALYAGILLIGWIFSRFI